MRQKILVCSFWETVLVALANSCSAGNHYPSGTPGNASKSLAIEGMQKMFPIINHCANSIYQSPEACSWWLGLKPGSPEILVPSRNMCVHSPLYDSFLIGKHQYPTLKFWADNIVNDVLAPNEVYVLTSGLILIIFLKSRQWIRRWYETEQSNQPCSQGHTWNPGDVRVSSDLRRHRCSRSIRCTSTRPFDMSG